jgi:hypothetical protein
MSSLIKSFIFIIPNKKTLKEISMTSKSLKTSQEIERLAQSSRIGYFGSLPNELIVNILENLSLEELSLIAITNKSFRDLIIDFFIKSNTGFRNMLSETYDSTNANTIERQEKRTQTFKSLGFNYSNFRLINKLKVLLNLKIRSSIKTKHLFISN